MNPIKTELPRCYVCVGDDQDGDCGDKIRPNGGFNVTQICEHGCLVSAAATWQITLHI